MPIYLFSGPRTKREHVRNDFRFGALLHPLHWQMFSLPSIVSTIAGLLRSKHILIVWYNKAFVNNGKQLNIFAHFSRIDSTSISDGKDCILYVSFCSTPTISLSFAPSFNIHILKIQEMRSDVRPVYFLLVFFSFRTITMTCFLPLIAVPRWSRTKTRLIGHILSIKIVGFDYSTYD